jgi:hypothetical protein
MFGKPRLQQLAEIAGRSEAVRWKRKVNRSVTRAALGGGAVVLGLMFILGLHAFAWNVLSTHLGEIGTALVLVATDLVAALVLGMLAMRGLKDPLKEDARQVRNTATCGMRREIHTVGGLLRPKKQAAAPAAPRPTLLIGRRRR